MMVVFGPELPPQATKLRQTPTTRIAVNDFTLSSVVRGETSCPYCPRPSSLSIKHDPAEIVAKKTA